MNFFLDGQENEKIRYGDTCVIYMNTKVKHLFKVDEGQFLTTKFGTLLADSLVGHRYGVRFDCSKGWIIPLRLTPELWTQLLPHRTQILYEADISLILLKLDIKPGSIVAESGTGSGSLSHAIIRNCLPDGHLYTFDINSSSTLAAQRDFSEHGYQSNATPLNRNIVADGFPVVIEDKCDACILDLPQTWEAVGAAHKILKKSGSILCSFSPCIEQVQKTVAKMREYNFKNIEMVECLMMHKKIEEKKLRNWSTEVMNKLVAVDKEKFDNIRDKLATGDFEKNASSNCSLPVQKKMKLDELVSDTLNHSKGYYQDTEIEEFDRQLLNARNYFTPNILPTVNLSCAVPASEEYPSHSGFLTFARLGP